MVKKSKTSGKKEEKLLHQKSVDILKELREKEIKKSEEERDETLIARTYDNIREMDPESLNEKSPGGG